ncbi:MAG TPA: aspartyl protease family protein [Fimbriimonadaceae bacterium]|nr:aspartyl protease family protein [Fimbriimonadaceae bacterium]
MVLVALSLLAVSRPQTPIAEADFDMVGGRIYVPAEIGGHKTSVILDSGAGTAVMEKDLADEWNLPSAGEVPVGGVGKERVMGKLLKDVKVSVGEVKTPMRIALPLLSLAAAEGRRLDSIIGFEFFKSHVVEVDYAKRHVRIFGPDGPASSGKAVPVRIVNNHPHITTEIAISGKTYSMETMIDSGASGSGLTARFVKNNPFQVPTTAKTVIGGGVGGFIEGTLFRPDSVTIGGVSLAKPIMTMTTEGAGGSPGAASLYDLSVGADLLKRFKVTFDYPHNRMIFEPSADASKPFEADKAGMRIYAEGKDLRTFRVKGVLPGSSSDRAGVKAEDIIETVNGKPASSLSLTELRELFRSGESKGWSLGLLRGEQRVTIRVDAKSVI